MKTLDRAFLIAGLISLSFLIGVSSCDENEKSEDDSGPTKQVIESRLKESQWKINFPPEKDHFTSYSFTFNNDGSIIAVEDNGSISGTWSTFNSRNGELRLNIEFPAEVPFDALNDDWVIVETTDRSIILKDVGSTAVDKVTFEKV